MPMPMVPKSPWGVSGSFWGPRAVRRRTGRRHGRTGAMESVLTCKVYDLAQLTCRQNPASGTCPISGACSAQRQRHRLGARRQRVQPAVWASQCGIRETSLSSLARER